MFHIVQIQTVKNLFLWTLGVELALLVEFFTCLCKLNSSYIFTYLKITIWQLGGGILILIRLLVIIELSN
jgi:hypothetical protein